MGDKTKSMDDRRREKAEEIIKKMREDQLDGKVKESDIKAQKKQNKESFGHEGE